MWKMLLMDVIGGLNTLPSVYGSFSSLRCFLPYSLWSVRDSAYSTGKPEKIPAFGNNKKPNSLSPASQSLTSYYFRCLIGHCLCTSQAMILALLAVLPKSQFAANLLWLVWPGCSHLLLASSGHVIRLPLHFFLLFSVTWYLVQYKTKLHDHR